MTRLNMKRLPILFLLLMLIGSAAPLFAQQRVLLIASSYGKGTGPFTSTIQTPLESAGYNVTVWAQATQGWPPIDTLWNYHAVFFHGSERRGNLTIDSILTKFAELGGRLVVEGSNVASFAHAYEQWRQHGLHTHYLKTDHSALTNRLVAPAHPIAAGLPSTFACAGYSGGNYPEQCLPVHGGTLVIDYSSTPGTVAVVATPHTAFYVGSLQRVSTAATRNLLIQNLVAWVLSDPVDCGLIDFDYQWGTSVGNPCGAWAKVRNFAAAPASGMVRLEVSEDSTNWSAADSAYYSLVLQSDDTLDFTWTPQNPVRYHLRATLIPDGADGYAENNVAVKSVFTFHETPHPRLFFTAAEIPTLQAQAASTHLAIANALTNRIALYLSYNPLAPELWPNVNYSFMAEIVSDASLKAVITPTPTYIDNAVNKTLALCRYPQWEPGTNQNMDIYSGKCCQALALAYDWLYPYFTKPQRDTLQMKLREQMERLSVANEKWIWWTDAYLHNHNTNCMSYLGAASYALLDEDPQAQEWEQMAIANLDNIMLLYGDVTDGSWYEAMNYWGFISWTMLPHLYLLREQMNVDYFDTPFIQSLAKFRIYGSTPYVYKMPMINEAQPDEWYGPEDQLYLLAHEYNDGEAQWLAQQVVTAMGYSFDGPFAFLFYDPNITPVQPTDLSWIATDQDTYFGRSQWNNTAATYVTLKCGLVGGRHCYTTYWGSGAVGGWEPSHFQPDQNAFTLQYDGDYILQSAGLQSIHRTYNGNTMLVNGYGQIGDSTKGSWQLPANRLDMNPHLADTFCLKTVDYVVGDATTSYPAYLGLQRFHRHLLYVRPDMVMIVDRMKTASPSTFTFIMRNRSDVFAWDADKVTLDGDFADANMFMLEPAARTTSESFNYYYSTQWGGWGFRESNATPDTAVKFVNVFYPKNPNSATAQLLSSTYDLTAAKLGDGIGFEATCAIVHGNLDTVSVDSLFTDASLAVVLRNDAINNVTGGAVRWCKFLDWGSPARRLFESSQPADLEWTYVNDIVDVNGSYSDWARFYGPTLNVVRVNGDTVPSFRDGDFIEIGSRVNIPPELIQDLTILPVNGDLLLQWSPVTFVIGESQFQPDFYDVYSAVNPDSAFTLWTTVAGTESSCTVSGFLGDQGFFRVDARLEPGTIVAARKRE